jgi:hypothetical protein
MMLVILRDGTERLYPSATYCDLSTSVWSFYTTKGGTWLASFPQDFVALVDSTNESNEPCDNILDDHIVLNLN